MESETTIANQQAFNSTFKAEEAIITSPPAQVENYELYSPAKRRFYLILVALAGLMAPMVSTITFPSTIQMREDFQTNDTLMDLSVSIVIFMFGIAPLFWGGGSDMYGRRWVYIISQTLFTLSCVGCALSPNVEVYILMRVFQGIGSSAPLVVGIGTISDIYPREETGTALGLFFVGPLIGPIIGPIVGGYLAKYIGWRAIFWLMTGIAGAILIIMILFLKETLPEDRLCKFPLRITLNPLGVTTKGGQIFNPFSPLYYVIYPIVSLGSLYAAIVFAPYFATTAAQTRGMIEFYHLDIDLIGLTYIPIGVGSILGSVLGGKLSDIIIKRTIKRDGKAKPEKRYTFTIIGAIAILAGLFMNGWFIEHQVALGATLFSQILIGLGMTQVFGDINTYLVEVYPLYTGSVIAVVNCVRMVGAGIISTFNSIILDRLNFGWCYSLFGFFQVIGILILFVMAIFGPKIRGSSD